MQTKRELNSQWNKVPVFQHEFTVPDGTTLETGDIAMVDGIDGFFVYDGLSKEYFGPHDWDHAQELSNHFRAGN